MSWDRHYFKAPASFPSLPLEMLAEERTHFPLICLTIQIDFENYDDILSSFTNNIIEKSEPSTFLWNNPFSNIYGYFWSACRFRLRIHHFSPCLLNRPIVSVNYQMAKNRDSGLLSQLPSRIDVRFTTFRKPRVLKASDESMVAYKNCNTHQLLTCIQQFIWRWGFMLWKMWLKLS